MRKLGMLLGAMLLAILVLPAFAQQRSASSFLTGVDPSRIKPLDPAKYNKVIDTSNMMRRPSGMTTFNTSKVFPRISLGSWPPKLPQVSVLPQSMNPFQPKVVGINAMDLGKKKK